MGTFLTGTGIYAEDVEPEPEPEPQIETQPDINHD